MTDSGIHPPAGWRFYAASWKRNPGEDAPLCLSAGCWVVEFIEHRSYFCEATCPPLAKVTGYGRNLIHATYDAWVKAGGKPMAWITRTWEEAQLWDLVHEGTATTQSEPARWSVDFKSITIPTEIPAWEVAYWHGISAL